jgi:hypothetical protein
VAHLAGTAQLGEPAKRVEIARHVIFPPVELHEIERFDAEARKRSVDDRLDVRLRYRRERLEVGNELRRDRDPPRVIG